MVGVPQRTRLATQSSWLTNGRAESRLAKLLFPNAMMEKAQTQGIMHSTVRANGIRAPAAARCQWAPLGSRMTATGHAVADVRVSGTTSAAESFHPLRTLSDLAVTRVLHVSLNYISKSLGRCGDRHANSIASATMSIPYSASNARSPRTCCSR